MICACGHEYDEHHPAHQGCDAVIEDEEGQFVACPCVHFEASDDHEERDE